MFGGLFEGWHPIVLLVIALIVFGPGKLPQVMGDMGKAVRTFRDEMDGTSALRSDNAKERAP